MNDLSIRSLAKLLALLILPIALTAQTPPTAAPVAADSSPQAATLAIAGQSDQVSLVQINGKSYVEVESLARIAHGSIQFQGNQTILTLPASASATASSDQTKKPPQLSEGFLSTEIEELAVIREWRAAIVYAVQANSPVTESWVGGLRRSAENRLTLATAAATTGPDSSAAALLHNEYENMQQMSDQFLTLHAKSSYTSADSFDNNPLDQKIMSCARGLASMAATKQFQDEPSCH
jgi:hypothetical protein